MLANYQFSALAVLTLLSSIIILCLGVYILFQNRKGIENISFFSCTLTAFLWLFGTAFCEAGKESLPALLWYKRCSFLGVSFIGAAVYFMIVSIIGQFPGHKRRIVIACLISAAFYLFVNSSGFIVTGTTLTPWGHYPRYGVLSLLFIAYFLILAIYGFALLVSGYRRAGDGLKKKQRGVVLIALLFAYTGISDFLLCFQFNVYPFGYVSILFFAIIAVYGINRFGLLVLDKKLALPVIFNAVSNFIIGFNNANKIIFVNRFALQAFGYKERNIIGQSIEKIFSEQEQFLRMRETLLTGGYTGEEDVFFLTKDGRQLLVRIGLSPIRDQRHKGRTLGFVLTGGDITARRRAEDEIKKHRDHLEVLVKERTAELTTAVEQLELEMRERKRAAEDLRASEEKYRTILESIEDGYYEVDVAGNLTFFNDRICGISGYSKDELVGMNNRRYMDSETAKKVYERFNWVSQTGESDKGFSFESTRKDGVRRSFEASISVMKDAEGHAVGFRGILRDTTEKKRLEAQLLNARKMEALGTIAGGIAHNFNNLLMGIQGNASLALFKTDADHPNYNRLKNIEKQVESGSRLTGQLLGYARGGRYEVRPISLNRLVKEAVYTFGEARKEIKVHQALAEDLSGMLADQGQIEQVLLNVCVNAVEAMPGGGDLFLKTMNVTHMDMTGKPYKVKAGDYVLLTVKDTGIGMEKKTMTRIFDPFFTTKGMSEGTGLGLASVYGIIKAHGGYIDVESEMGYGTTFEIYLPASEKKETKKKEPATKIIKGEGTILLVDDEDMVVDTSREILETLGYKVLAAGGGKEALEIYKKNRDRIDMVLLDMIMPDVGGGETYDRMKEINPDIKVLLSSGYSIEGQAVEILNRGCDGFIQKPFSVKLLSREIERILETDRIQVGLSS